MQITINPKEINGYHATWYFVNITIEEAYKLINSLSNQLIDNSNSSQEFRTDKKQFFCITINSENLSLRIICKDSINFGAGIQGNPGFFISVSPKIAQLIIKSLATQIYNCNNNGREDIASNDGEYLTISVSNGGTKNE